MSFLDDELLQWSGEWGLERLAGGNGAYADKGRTSGSEISPESSEAELSSLSSSESDETDGARKVPLLRGDLKERMTFE